jgi:hypothetical protein
MTLALRASIASLAVLTSSAGCGGGGGGAAPTSPPPSGTNTVTVTGTSRSAGPTTCSADNHVLNAGDGPVTVTLVQTTPAVSLIVQVCSPTTTNHQTDCSINRQRIDVGQTLSGTIRGGRVQHLSFNTLNCGPGALPPEPAPIVYSAAVTHPL